MAEEKRSTIELNDAQIALLNWIKDGCPDGVYPTDTFSHRISAKALQSRGLVQVSGHGKTWNAVPTDRGKVWPASTEADDAVRATQQKLAQAGAAQTQQPEKTPKQPRKAPKKPSAAELAARDLVAAEELIGQLLNAENEELLSTDLDIGPRKLQRYIAVALKAKNRPHGKQLTSRRIGGYGSTEEKIYFTNYFRDFVTEQPVPVPERVGRYHPAVKEFMANKQWQYVTKEHVPRAARILQAIASEAERRGIEIVAPSKKPDDRHYRTANATEHGNLWFYTDYGYYGIEIKEVAGTGAKKFRDLGMSWQQIDRLPSWIGRRGWEFISTGRLQITQGTSLGGYGETHVGDARGTALEDKLPEVFMRFDTWMLEQAERARLEQLAEEKKQRDWEAAMENAKAEYYIAERWKYFVSLAEQDERFQRFRDFLARAEDAISELPSEQRFAASGFLSEIEATMRRHDPLSSPELLAPQISPPKPEDLKPYLRGWSPYGAHRS